MLLTNLAETEWINIHCSEKLLQHVICVSRPKFSPSSWSQSAVNRWAISSRLMCLKYQIKLAKYCFVFKWTKPIISVNTEKLASACILHSRSSAVECTSFEMIQFLFDTTSSAFPPTLLLHNSSHIQRLTHEKVLNFNKYKKEYIPTYEANGSYILTTKQENIDLKGNTFSCTHGGYISFLYTCDGSPDCPNDDSDERTCTCDDNSHCKELSGNRTEHKCGYLYYQAVDGSCHHYCLQSNSTDLANQGLFWCNRSDITIVHSLMDDLVPDCGSQGEDELVLMSMLQQGTRAPCLEPGQLPCLEGHPKCYYFYQICKYQLDKQNKLYPCRNGGHLVNCKSFECNNNFKCHKSHCISWASVCDGKWDCSFGEDEEFKPVCGKGYSCSGMFKCKDTDTTCIHLGDVCDDVVNCPLNDDEFGCSLTNICPCQCLGFAIFCQNTKLNFLNDMYNYLSLTLLNSFVSHNKNIFQIFPEVLMYKQRGGEVADICSVSLPKPLIFFNMSFTDLSSLKQNCFKMHLSLQCVLLENNCIESVSSKSFYNLRKLQLVGLSRNPLSKIPRLFVVMCPLVRLISLRKLNLIGVDQNSFDSILTGVVDTDDHHVCCLTHENLCCSAKRPWFVACEDLLPGVTKQIFFVSISFTIVVLNIVSFITNTLTWKSNKTMSIIVFSTNICHCLCSVYLHITWIAHFSLEGTFMVMEQIWRTSSSCFSAFGIILAHSVLSALALLLLALSRLMVVVHPVDSQFKRVSYVSKLIASAYLFTLVFTLCVSLSIKFVQHTLPFSLCLPYADPSNSVMLLRIITVVITTAQFLCVVAMSILHGLLVKHLIASQLAVRALKVGDVSNVPVFVQLLTISISTAVSWTSTNIIFCVTIFLSRFPVELVTWTTIATMPMNSYIYPVVFLILAIRKKMMLKDQWNT